PYALFGLLLLPILVIFYMWRARHTRQVVSSTWLWAEAMARFSHKPTRQLPLRDPLLLLQLLAALLLVFYLAGPRAGHTAPSNRIVVLDDSIAMAATDVAPSRLVHAEHQIQSLITGLGAGDHLSVILAGPRARLLGQTPGGVDLPALLRALPQPSGAADLAGAAALARGLAGTPDLGTPRVTFIAARETAALPAGGLPVTTIRVGRTEDDQSISGLAVACSPKTNQCQAFARVRNSAAAARTDTLTASADGQSLGDQALHLPARGSLELSFVVPQGTRVVKATLAGTDAVPGDNTAVALSPTPPALRALLVSDSPGPLSRALRDVPGLSVRVITVEAYQDSDAIGPDLVVMDNLAPPNLPNIPLLMVHPPADSGLVNVRNGNVFLPMALPDPTDPLVADLDLDGMAGNGEAIDTPPWATVDAGTASTPLLLHGSQGGNRTVVLPFEPSAGAFAQDVAFPLLIERLVRWLVPPPPTTIG
ncbi:MAG: vWA domain-containing protein, partial [Chloroflexota bacterium]